MHSLKTKFPTPWAVVVLPVFLLLCSHAHAASDALTENFYARAGGGVYFLDMSESSPFIRTNGREEVIGFLDHYDASFQAGPLVNLAVGGEYDAFGKSLFTEVSGFLTFYSSMHVNNYDEDPAPWTDALAEFDRRCPINPVDGSCPITSETEPLLVSLIQGDPDVRSVGWIGKIDGGAISFGAPNFAWGDPIRISTKREVDFHGVDLVTGMFFGQTGRARTSLFIGPSYKRLNQESETFAYESNRAPEVNNLTLTEELDAWYWGGVIGTRIDLPFKERWKFTFDGRLGLYYLDAQYNGSQRTLLTSSDPDLDEPTAWATSDSAVATTLNFQTALSVTCLERVTFQLGTGVEYLSHAPRMRYASLGESFKSGVTHAPARIEYSSAFGVFTAFSIVLRL
ncbi:MAG: hypothetical protein F4X63_01595 [Nitrospira sp. SB0662_bin_26]|nr:hypothetical protein [Nitrospira sp. SB0662_bin_26]